MSSRPSHLPIAADDHQPTPNVSSRECQFCYASFSRVDGARRHAKVCSRRDGRPLPLRKRGRKTNSCDACSRVKVHCSARNQASCERCVSRKVECTFSRSCTVAADPKPFNHGQRQTPSSFLLNVTDDKQDFITEKAVGQEPDGDLLGPTCVTPQSDAPNDEAIDIFDPTLLLSFDAEACLDFNDLYPIEEGSLLGAFLSPSLQEDRLSARLRLLEEHVAAHASCYDKNPFDSTTFRQFFSASDVHTFAMMFCRKRHYQYPIIHWPTFVLEEASLPLLMVVALTGATYSYRPGHGPEHITDARRLYRLADSYIFHQLRLCLDGQSSAIDSAEAIQLCQAALLMYALETLSAGDSDLQHSAMTECLPALISAIRQLHFADCRHDSAEDWQQFLHHEKIIRLVSWTFCADCLATLSCNQPPKFSLLEMTGDLPCDTTKWEIDSAAAFELLGSPRQNTPCLKSLMSTMLDDNCQADGNQDLALFDLHIMLCAFQPIIFYLHVSLCLVQQSAKLLKTLNSWRHLWAQAMEKIPDNHRKWLGVAKNVLDIEHLSRRIIEVAISPEAASSRYLQRVPSYNAKDIHEFIRDFASKP